MKALQAVITRTCDNVLKAPLRQNREHGVVPVEGEEWEEGKAVCSSTQL